MVRLNPSVDTAVRATAASDYGIQQASNFRSKVDATDPHGVCPELFDGYGLS